ncbi:MAG: hypothetical protein ACLQFM_10245 [Terriglobales bacterium]
METNSCVFAQWNRFSITLQPRFVASNLSGIPKDLYVVARRREASSDQIGGASTNWH